MVSQLCLHPCLLLPEHLECGQGVRGRGGRHLGAEDFISEQRVSHWEGVRAAQGAHGDADCHGQCNVVFYTIENRTFFSFYHFMQVKIISCDIMNSFERNVTKSGVWNLLTKQYDICKWWENAEDTDDAHRRTPHTSSHDGLTLKFHNIFPVN